MKAKVIALEGKAADGEISLNQAVFGLDVRKDILHRVVNWQLAKRQAGTHKVKNRMEVTGSTRKLFKQKGTGNARMGDKKTPQRRGGGVAMGPVVRSHAHALPKKIRALGLKIALSSKQSGGKLLILKNDTLTDAKTAPLAKRFDDLGIKSALVITGAMVNDNFKKAAANIKCVDVLPVQGANVYDILRRENLLITEEALKALEARLHG